MLHSCLWNTLDQLGLALAFGQGGLAHRFAQLGVAVWRAGDEPFGPHVLERDVGVASERRGGAELPVVGQSILKLPVGLPRHPGSDRRRVAVLVDVVLRSASQILDSLRGFVVSDHQDVPAIVVIRLSESEATEGSKELYFTRAHVAY